MKNIIILILFIVSLNAQSQNYTSYFTGNSTDMVTAPNGGVCLMGGASEHDEAMKWFLQNANGGDVVVIRTSGSDGYNNYMYSQLGVSVNSVETIVFNHPDAANETYIHDKLAKAEAIWMAGGNQWNYISYWRNTPIDSIIRDGIQHRNIVIGGTSAGMAVLGGAYFTAQNGTIYSNAALANPFHNHATIDTAQFFDAPFLQNVITDTHYNNPDRKGRQVVFMAKMLMDFGIDAKGIACDEYTSIWIDTSGIARAYGDFPSYNDNVYFLQINCENANPQPENYTNGQPLNWNLNGNAIKTYRILATNDGSKYFDLNDWKTGNGGIWEDWSVDNGSLVENIGNPINCIPVSTVAIQQSDFKVYPNPVTNSFFTIESTKPILRLEIYNAQNQRVQFHENLSPHQTVDISNLNNGIYFLKANHTFQKMIVLQ